MDGEGTALAEIHLVQVGDEDFFHGTGGGEEFVVVLPETALAGAVRFAERMRERIEHNSFASTHGGVRMTASIGVASYPAPGVHTVDDLFARADEALYRAKSAGRNQVCE